MLITGNANTEGWLDIVAGNTSPVVTADTASIGSNAIFNLSGYSAPESTSATQLAENQFRVIQTSGAGNLTGNFSTVSLGGSTSSVDYLTMTATNDGQNYDIGLALTWYAAHTITPEHALGTFTLSAANEFFDLDVLLADETANAITGWDGKTLTKAGAGTLQLSKSNTYTGSTLINGGTLLAGGTDIIADSSKVTVASGANFDLNHFDQRVNNLSGAGNVILGDAILTANNTVDNTFSGVISGAGGMNKTGSGTLLLTGNNAYIGGTTITEGTLQLGNGGTGGSLVSDITNNGLLIFNRSDDYLYNNVISGSGDVTQQGQGIVYFDQNETYAGKTNVNAGALILTNNVLLTSTQPVTVARGAIFGGYGGVNGDVVNHGLLAVADAAPGYSNAPAGNFTVGGNMTNNGEIRMESPAPASQLLVKGNYVGNNGLLTLSTVLGGDNSLTDKLVVQGNTSGSTNVVVNSAGGAGAQTVNGIEIISVAGQSNGLFTLVNRVVAGPYEYALYQGKPNSPDGNWYLRSEGPGDVPQWRPESGAYLGNQMLVSQLQMLTLYDRQGSQFNSADTGAWGRIITSKVDSKAANGSVDISSDYTLVQLGGDVWNIGDGVQGLSVGVMGSWGNGDTDSTGMPT
ncbi:autotransporter outer membrane beta-barrel domain-containing protein [Budvicia aquatica]|uniref:AIDA-I autotransporter n=1 Tax=Budvicia aquatica TaxID=82979 RepID=A0A485A010_9GAMM|nr:autotransporter outer membrane beta-barrel domain-containing protein [Budvicia aquatica]VFS50839.1 AIDA-I autotransporter precursor [Budvicia aquatica]